MAMTDKPARAPEGATDAPTDPEAAAAAPGPGADAADRDPGQPAEAAADPAQEAAELRDRWLRALAEMENLRRRTSREVADARTYGISMFARDLLAIADNMRRALDAFAAEHRETADAGTKALLEGIELTERELLKVLEKHGVTRLEPEGGKFDPHRHQAMYEVPDPSVPAGTVVQVVQPGYMIGDRVLRPALVAVAKGGPKAANGAAEPAGALANDNAPADDSPGAG